MATAIGIDLGGTRIKGVLLSADGKILHQCYAPTNDDNNLSWKHTVEEIVNDLHKKSGEPDLVVGISAPGISNEDNTAIAFMPGRMQGLENLIWSDFLKKKVWVLNDGLCSLLAEARLGVAQRKKNAVLLTLGTGVGGAILIEGKIYQGAFHKAGHMGHSVMDQEAEQDVTGMPGSLENAIGNVTLEKRSLGKFASTKDLLAAYNQGDYFAQWVWLTSVRKLAIGIASITNILSPECVILGGGITEAGKDLFDPLERFLSLYEWRTGGNKAEIFKAAFGDMAGAIGAACFAKEQESKK